DPAVPSQAMRHVEITEIELAVVDEVVGAPRGRPEVARLVPKPEGGQLLRGLVVGYPIILIGYRRGAREGGLNSAPPSIVHEPTAAKRVEHITRIATGMARHQELAVVAVGERERRPGALAMLSDGTRGPPDVAGSGSAAQGAGDLGGAHL